MGSFRIIHKFKLVLLAVLLLLFCGCGRQNAENDAASEDEIQTVSENGQTTETASAEEIPTDSPDVPTVIDSNKRVITVQRITADIPTGTSGTISSAPSSYTDDDTETTGSGAGTTGKGTPVTFDVDDCMIQVGGNYDTKLSGEILTALNSARTQAGLEAFDTNAGLGKAADVRSKEITYAISHQRANGSYWNTVAPEYFEAECLAVDYTDAVTTVNAWISEESTRQFLLSDELCSIGVSCFQYADNYYIVAAIGR